MEVRSGLVKFCVMLIDTWSVCIQMNILLMSGGLIVCLQYLMWKRCTFHHGHGMWFTSSRVLSDLGIFRHPLEHTSPLCAKNNNCVQSFGFLRSVPLCMYLCVFFQENSERELEREKNYLKKGLCVFFKAGTYVGLVFLLVLG